MKRLPLVALVLVAACAHGPRVPAGAKTVPEALSRATTYDSRLAGETWYAFEINGFPCRMHEEVGPAPAGSGAVYSVTRRYDLPVGKKRMTGTSITLLDGTLALVSKREQLETRSASTEPDASLQELKAEGGRLVAREDGREKTFEGTAPIYTEEALCLVARQLDRPGTYELTVQGWGGNGLVPAHVEVAAPATFEHRGETVSGRVVTFVTEAGRRIVQVAPGGCRSQQDVGGGPFDFVAGTPEEVGVPPVFGPEDPRGPVLVYVRALADEVSPEALDGHVDWDALAGNLGVADGEAVRAGLLGAIEKKRGAFGPATADEIGRTMEARIDGDTAEVVLDHDTPEAALRLRRAGDHWVIVDLPH